MILKQVMLLYLKSYSFVIFLVYDIFIHILLYVNKNIIYYMCIICILDKHLKNLAHMVIDMMFEMCIAV